MIILKDGKKSKYYKDEWSPEAREKAAEARKKNAKGGKEKEEKSKEKEKPSPSGYQTPAQRLNKKAEIMKKAHKEKIERGKRERFAKKTYSS